MVEEALQGESKKDFIHKLSITNKEANETVLDKIIKRYNNEAESLILNVEELIKLLVSIIKSTKASIKK